MSRTIGFGLVGATGLIGPFHVRAIEAAAGARLVGVMSRDPARAARFAGEHGCRAYGSMEEMLADGDVDAVDIMTPNHLHAGAAIEAARAGKHVIVEKPPAMSLADVDAMAGAAKGAGVKLAVILNCRVRAAIAAMREAAAAGRFGRILRADAIMKWWRGPEYYAADPWRGRRDWGAGVTIQQGFHYVDLLQYLAGPVRRVEARMANLAHPGVDVEDSVQAFLEFQSGAVGSFVGSTALWPGFDVRIELCGQDGAAVMVGERMETWKFREERPDDDAVAALGRAGVGTGAGGAADLDFSDHQKLIEDLVRAIREDGEPMITAAGARHSLEICLAMYRSAKGDGRAVELPLDDEAGIFD